MLRYEFYKLLIKYYHFCRILCLYLRRVDINNFYPETLLEKENLKAHKVNVFLYSNKNTIPTIKQNNKKYYQNISVEANNAICKHWLNHKNTEQSAFNGNLVKCNYFDLQNNLINISAVDYKAFLASSDFNFYTNFPDKIANPLTVSPIIITKDRKLVIGYRKNTSFLQFPGGMLDYDKDIVNKELSLIACAKREIKEELCDIKTHNYKFLGASISLKQIFSTTYLYCQTSKTFNEIVNIRNQQKVTIPDFWEMPEIDFMDVSAKSFSGALDKKFIGTAYAGILLLGRRLFGKKWYQKNKRNKFGGIYLDFSCK